MNASKDYYATLGVLPSAEDIVIRAAYKALAQRYHPDKWTGAMNEAERRMREINEAYAVLSDPNSRAKYDATRKAEGAEEAFDAEEEGVRDAFEEEEAGKKADWDVAIEYFPDLVLIYADLRRTAVSLGFSFKTILLESKKFMSRYELAESLRHAFLQTYFGSNPQIIAFAKELIGAGQKQAAKELNRAVSILGSDVEARIVIDRIRLKFAKPKAKWEKWPSYVVERAKRFVSGNVQRTYLDAQSLIEMVKGTIKLVYMDGDPRTSVVSYYEVFAFGESNQFRNREELFSWLAVTLEREVLG